jgi:hypothetical protein
MAILGIHTDVPDKNDPQGSHSWITIESDGVTRDFALYSQGYPILDVYGQENGWDGSGKTCVREGIDSKTERMPTESLYQEITPEQEAAFWKHIEQPQYYLPKSHNCAHWSSQTWEKTTGQHLDITSQKDSGVVTGRTATYESPVGLENSIKEKNQEKALEADTGKPAQTAPALEESAKPTKQLKFFEDERASPSRTPSADREGGQASQGKTLTFFEDHTPSQNNDLGR